MPYIPDAVVNWWEAKRQQFKTGVNKMNLIPRVAVESGRVGKPIKSLEDALGRSVDPLPTADSYIQDLTKKTNSELYDDALAKADAAYPDGNFPDAVHQQLSDFYHATLGPKPTGQMLGPADELGDSPFMVDKPSAPGDFLEKWKHLIFGKKK